MQIIHLSVASWSFAIEVRSSVLFIAETLVSGVLAALPAADLVPGVEVDVGVSPAARFAAFSASLFCLDADGGISVKRRKSRWMIDEST